MSESEPIVVFADYVCPFCYLGKQSLETYQESRDDPLDREWRPFDLRAQKRDANGDIDHSVDDGKDEDYFDEVRENIARLKEEYGAEEMLGLDETPEVDSLNAQIASLYVRETHPDAWADFDDALYEALWEDGRDVGDADVIADVAADVGLDAADVTDAVADEDWRAAVFDHFDDAQREGITGVPTFAYDGYAARGAVPPAQLERLVEGA
ncbi:MAG: DsbA family protein [Halobacteriaceae archaeon]